MAEHDADLARMGRWDSEHLEIAPAYATCLDGDDDVVAGLHRGNWALLDEQRSRTAEDGSLHGRRRPVD